MIIFRKTGLKCPVFYFIRKPEYHFALMIYLFFLNINKLLSTFAIGSTNIWQHD